MSTQTSIPCSPEVRDLVQAQKRGGESYNEVLAKMCETYEPEA